MESTQINTNVYFVKIECVDFSKSFTKADLENSPTKTVNVWDIHTQQDFLCKSSIEEKKKKIKRVSACGCLQWDNNLIRWTSQGSGENRAGTQVTKNKSF